MLKVTKFQHHSICFERVITEKLTAWWKTPPSPSSWCWLKYKATNLIHNLPLKTHRTLYSLFRYQRMSRESSPQMRARRKFWMLQSHWFIWM